MSMIKSLIFFRNYRKDPTGTVSDLLRNDNGRSALNIFGKNVLITSKAEDVNYVLKENANNYLKGRTTQKLQVLLGQGLVTAEGETWRKQHRLIRPLMNTKGIMQLLPKMNEVIESHFKNFPQKTEVNISKDMALLTWRIVLNALFSVGHDAHKEEDSLEGILDVMEGITNRTRSMLPIPFWVPTAKNRKMKKVISDFDRFVYELIAKRKQMNDAPNDLLTLLLLAKDEQSQMSDQQVRDEAITFLMAGHETVANSMSWLMILLAQNPSYIQKLREEQASLKDGESFEERVLKMPLHRACIDEAQRLYPPVWIFMREAIAADSFNSIHIKEKTNVVVVPYVSHRSKEYWDKAEEFYPERFMNNFKPKAGSYYPFSLGPRACIGANFAIYEAMLILEKIVKSFDWEIISPSSHQEMNAGLTLRPTSNINMKVTRV